MIKIENCKSLLLGLLVLIATSLHAQGISLFMPRHGDVLQVQTVSGIQVDSNQGGFLLNLSDMKETGLQFRVSFSGVSSTDLSCETPLHRSTLGMCGDTLFLHGLADGKTTVVYDHPIVWLSDALLAGDSLVGSFHGRGTFCDRLQVEQEGTLVSRAQTDGALILPSGDTLRNVLMVVTNCHFSTACLPTDSISFPMHNWLSEESQHLSDMTVSTSRFYARGYRYPLVEISEWYPTGIASSLRSSAMYCPPTMQEELAFDEENETLRSLLRQEPQDPFRESPSDSENGNRPYSFLQDDVARCLTFTYDLGEPATVHALLCNTEGMVYRSATQHHETGRGYMLTLNYSGLHHGQYVVRFSLGSETFMETFQIR